MSQQQHQLGSLQHAAGQPTNFACMLRSTALPRHTVARWQQQGALEPAGCAAPSPAHFASRPHLLRSCMVAVLLPVLRQRHSWRMNGESRVGSVATLGAPALGTALRREGRLVANHGGAGCGRPAGKWPPGAGQHGASTRPLLADAQ